MAKKSKKNRQAQTTQATREAIDAKRAAREEAASIREVAVKAQAAIDCHKLWQEGLEDLATVPLEIVKNITKAMNEATILMSSSISDLSRLQQTGIKLSTQLPADAEQIEAVINAGVEAEMANLVDENRALKAKLGALERSEADLRSAYKVLFERAEQAPRWMVSFFRKNMTKDGYMDRESVVKLLGRLTRWVNKAPEPAQVASDPPAEEAPVENPPIDEIQTVDFRTCKRVPLLQAWADIHSVDLEAATAHFSGVHLRDVRKRVIAETQETQQEAA